MAVASKGVIDAFGSFGELFLELSKQLQEELLSPMEAIQNNLKEAFYLIFVFFDVDVINLN